MRSLYREVYSDENLTEAWHHVRTRSSEAPGVDGVTLTQFQRYLFRELRKLQRELETGRYEPLPVRITSLKKSDGGYRPIGILAVRDRVARRAVLNVIEPLFEAIFEPTSFGFRPGRSREMALDCVAAFVNQGNTWTVHFDIERCFEGIDPKRLGKLLSRVVKDRKLLRLLNAWLHPTGVLQKGPSRPQPIRGLLQGSPLSPLLANVYLDQFDKRCRRKGIPAVRFADDILLLARSQKEVRGHFKTALRMLRDLGLRVNPEKTRFAHVEEGIEFLGGTLVFDEEEGIWVARFPEEEGEPDVPVLSPTVSGGNHDGEPLRG